MSVGLPVDKNVLDSRVGNLAWQLRETLSQVQTVKTWLDGKTDQELQAAPYGYSPTEVATMKSAFTDLDKLARIANGQGTQADANDFFFWADKLTGLQ
jgi:hypothetical protein